MLSEKQTKFTVFDHLIKTKINKKMVNLFQYNTKTMKRLLILGFLSLISFNISAQEEKMELITELDIPPIISGCDSTVDKKEIVICLQDRFSKLLIRNLKFSVFQKQNLPNGKYHINTFFKISKEAKITDIKVDYDNDEIVNEIIRALKKIKIKNPGIIDGKPVGVKYTLPIYFTLE